MKYKVQPLYSRNNKATMEEQKSQDAPTDFAKLAKLGLALMINNRVTESEEIFRTNPGSIQMTAGHAYVLFMDALMSFEEDKLDVALTFLRQLEKKCAADIGWVKSAKTKTSAKNLAHRIEAQIILADTQICIAIITFLQQQEFSAYLKCGWVLRKAWKIYHHTYIEIENLYKQKFGTFNLPEPTDFEWTDSISTMSRASGISTMSGVGTSGSPDDPDKWSIPDPNSASNSRQPAQNGYAPISSPDLKPNIPHSQSTYIFSNIFPLSIRRSGSAHSSLTNTNSTTPNHSSSTFSLFSPFSSTLSFLTSTFNFFTSSDNIDIDNETIARLMSAVCFGYGLVQLGLSLMPPAINKVGSLFGCHGNRLAGISNLMYARKGADMRAPFATLALLWYHTIIRPYYGLDGNNVRAGMEAASLLILESNPEYSDSALFLFFKGRIDRLDSNFSKAIESFELASNHLAQREVKLLAMHEAGWCYIMQLDYVQAHNVFAKLRATSRWSKSFYLYLIIICSGSVGGRSIKDIQDLRVLQIKTQKITPVDLYIRRRLKIFPTNEEQLMQTHDIYWKMFVYELIYLWNNLPGCCVTSIYTIIADCTDNMYEPMPGLAKLILGDCFFIIDDYDNAIDALRQSIHIRSTVTPKNDVHVSAFAEFTLGVILIRNPAMKQEGKILLERARNYKDYDFESKLSIRINMALKSVS